jgi:hypothetical protein
MIASVSWMSYGSLTVEKYIGKDGRENSVGIQNNSQAFFARAQKKKVRVEK